MTRNETLRYEMFVRVRRFGTDHRYYFPESSTGGKALAAVAVAVEAIKSHATEKRNKADGGSAAKKAARQALFQQLAVIKRTARLVARETPSAGVVFDLRKQRSDSMLLHAAGGVIFSLRGAEAPYVSLGLPDTFVQDLEHLVDRFEEASNGRTTARIQLFIAQGGITKAIALGFDAVRTLDVVVANMVKDADLLASWKRARLVDPKGKVHPETPAPQAAPKPPISLTSRRARRAS